MQRKQACAFFFVGHVPTELRSARFSCDPFCECQRSRQNNIMTMIMIWLTSLVHIRYGIAGPIAFNKTHLVFIKCSITTVFVTPHKQGYAIRAILRPCRVSACIRCRGQNGKQSQHAHASIITLSTSSWDVLMSCNKSINIYMLTSIWRHAPDGCGYIVRVRFCMFGRTLNPCIVSLR